MAVNNTNDNDWITDVQLNTTRPTIVLFGSLADIGETPTVPQERTDATHEEFTVAEEIINADGTDVDFLYADTDVAATAAGIASVGSLPTTVLYRRGVEVQRLYGEASSQDIVDAVVNSALPSLGVPIALDGDIYAMEPDGSGGYFIGGTFTSITDAEDVLGTSATSIIIGGSNVDVLVGNFTDGTVFAAIPDGDGGYIIGGNFTMCRGEIRRGLARVMSDGTVSDWDPQVNGTVYSLVLDTSGDPTVIVGGNFNVIGGKSRQNLAAIPLDSNSATTWNPGANDTVRCLALDNTWVIAGGDFTSLGGETRNYLGSVANNSNSASSWDPNLNGPAYAVATYLSSVIVGGDFTQVGADALDRLALIGPQPATSTANLTWVQNPDGVVRALAISADNYLHVGGDFTDMDGTARNHVAQFNLPSFALTAWDPNTNGSVHTLATSDGGYVVIGGLFDDVGGQSVKNLAVTTTTSDTPLDTPMNHTKKTNDVVRASAFYDGDQFVIGGSFYGNGQQYTRQRLAHINADGTLDISWICNADSTVFALARVSDILFVGGSFTQIGGTAHQNFCAVDIPSSNDLPNNLDADNIVTAIKRRSSTSNVLIVGGAFSTFMGQPRDKLAIIDAPTLTLSSWAPSVNPSSPGSVLSIGVLASGGTYAIVGGDFSTVDGQSRSNIAAISLSTGNVSSWNPGADNTVRALAIDTDNNIVYAGGDFGTLGGVTRNYIGAVEYGSDSALVGWAPLLNNSVHSLDLNVRDVFAGGAFNASGPFIRGGIASFARDGGALTFWRPGVNNTVRALGIYNSVVTLGGGFTGADFSAGPVPTPICRYFTYARLA
jgi:hypothetical protein